MGGRLREAETRAAQGEASVAAAEAEALRHAQRVEELTRQLERAMQEVDVKQSRLEALSGELLELRHNNDMEQASGAARYDALATSLRATEEVPTMREPHPHRSPDPHPNGQKALRSRLGGHPTLLAGRNRNRFASSKPDTPRDRCCTRGHRS